MSENVLERSEMPAIKPRAIFVVGMHRSGTSALAGLLHLLGVNLSDDLLPPAADNEAGFWEHRSIMQVQERLLRSFRHSWFSVTPLPADWLDREQVQPFREELGALVERDFTASPIWGVKDPRLCLTLPLWQQLLGGRCDLKCALIVRNPTDVVRSLVKRDGMRPLRGYLLWLRSLIAAEHDSRPLPRSLTRYEGLLEDAPGAMRSVGATLQVDWPFSLADVAPAMSGFLRPSLRHHAAGDEQLLQDPDVPVLVRRAYAAAIEAARENTFEPLSDTLDEIRSELDDPANPWNAFLTELEQDYQHELVTSYHLNRERLGVIENLERERQELLAVIAHHERDSVLRQEQAAAQADLLRQQADNLQQRLTMAEQHAAELQQHAGNLETLRQAAETRLTEIGTAFEGYQAMAERTRADQEQMIASLTTSVAGLTSDLVEQQRRAAETQRAYDLDHAFLVDRLQQIWASRSWKLTAPLRGFTKPTLSRGQLVPVNNVEPAGEQRWNLPGNGPAQFVLPCQPLRGAIQIRLRVCAAETGAAWLYFDSGRRFNDRQRVELGRVGGDLVAVETRSVLDEPVYCFRLDLWLPAGTFTIEDFELRPIS